MRKFVVVAVFVSLLSCTAFAAEHDNYPKAEVFGGYQYTHFEGSVNSNGWDGSLNGNFNNWLGMTADFSGTYATVTGVNLHNFTYTFGPTLSLRENKTYTPFVHALFGGIHGTASVSNVSVGGNGFASYFGGGVDWNASRSFSIRLPQADWLLIHSSGSTSSKNVRLSFGIVGHF